MRTPTDLDAAIGTVLALPVVTRRARDCAAHFATFSGRPELGIGATRYDAILDLLMQVQPAPVRP